MLALGFLLLRGRSQPRVRRLALVLVTAGAIGNYLDRLVRGYVVDFVYIHHWPVFNVADVYITAGYVLLAFGFFVCRRSGPCPSGEPDSAGRRFHDGRGARVPRFFRRFFELT